ncbi:MAG: DUF979 domain-containing protein [Spirochaetota bacterium]|nr:DUF979 domain-containing protein [Spirochaetota bacterium]
MQSIILEIMYIFGGGVALSTGFYALKDKDNTARVGTTIFWLLFGTIFVVGKYIPSLVIGIFVLIMGFLTATKQVKMSVMSDSSAEYKQLKSLEVGNNIWIPTLCIGVGAIILASFENIGGLAGLGISSLVAFLIAIYLTKDSIKTGYFHDAPRLLHGMGAAVILPQLLGSLGAIFSKVGVGDVVANLMSGLVPIGNHLLGVVLYCVSMVLFTIIMGNGFAAFAVITAGIGIPFVINQGGDPAVVGALGLTAGYCGTLMTPMAANFNVVPISILEIKDKYKIIKIQFPFALILLCLHIVLMYFLAF